MKLSGFCILLFTVFSLVCSVQAQNDEAHKMALRQKFWAFQERIDEKDYTALFDAADLPGAAGVSFIWSYAHADGADPQTRPKALEAIKRAHGFKDSMQTKIGLITDREGDPTNAVEILTAIGNREAAEVIAPYLFDFRYPREGNHIDGRIYNDMAAQELGKMHFGDAPTPDGWGGYGPEKLIVWQKWAIAHAMVPKEWNARVGIPKWQYELAALEQRLRSPAPEKSVQLQPDPSDARRVGSQKPDRSSEAFQRNSKTINSSAPRETLAAVDESGVMGVRWVVWGSVSTAFAVVAGWLFVRSRRPKN